MKNEKLFAMIDGSSTVKTPDVLPRLTFDAAEKYKNTVTPKSPVRSYIKAAVIYAAACVVLLIAIPFIIGNVTDAPKPSGPVTEQTKPHINGTEETVIKAEDINEIYNNVDPETLPTKVTVEEVEKIIEAARLAYDEYDTVILKDGTKITTTPKKPDIVVEDLEYMYKGDDDHEEYKEYFSNLSIVVRDAVFARFPERALCVCDLAEMGYEQDSFETYMAFCVMDIEKSGFESADDIYNAMLGAQDFPKNISGDMIFFLSTKSDSAAYLSITYTDYGTPDKNMLFPTEEECAILMAELPENYYDSKLAIEDEILAAESVRSKEDLVKRGYKEELHEIYEHPTLKREIECQNDAVAAISVTYDLMIKRVPDVIVSEEEFFENGKMKIDVNIWTGFIIIDIDDLIVEQSNPVILPPEMEKELRYILNMPYKLAIEDELLEATGSKSKDELIEHGYEEITHGGETFLLREFECETGTAHFRIFNRELYITAHPFVDATDAHIPDLEDGKIYLTVDIWAGNCFIKMRVTVDDNFPIVLPEGAEKELRYILNIEKDDPHTEGIIADDIRYLDSNVGYKFAVIERDGKFGLVNTDGDIILPVEYSSIDLSYLAPDDLRMKLLATVSNETEYKTYWIETDGTPVEEFVGGWGIEGGVGIYWMNGKPLMLDSFNGEIEYSCDRYTSELGYKATYAVASGKQSDVIPIREIKGYTYTESMLFYSVEEDDLVSGKYALFNFRTKELITDFIFDDCSNQGFVEGVLPVKKDGKWGYVNESGEMITGFIYDASETREYYENIIETVYYTLNGYTIVRQGELFGLINMNGELVLDVEYDDISQVNPDGYVWMKEGSSWSVKKIS